MADQELIGAEVPFARPGPDLPRPAPNLAIVDGDQQNIAGEVLQAADDDEWKDYIKNHRDIGLVTLIFYHEQQDNIGIPAVFPLPFIIIGKIVLVLILIMQFYFLGVLATNVRIYKGDEEVSNEQKLLAFGVALLFLAFLLFLGMIKHQELENPSPLNQSDHGGILQKTVFFDRLMSFVFEPGFCLINVFHILMEKDSYTIIECAMQLAYPFAMKEVTKVYFITLFPPDIRIYRFLNNEGDGLVVPNCRVQSFWHFLFLKSNKKLNIRATIFCFGATLYGVIDVIWH